MRTPTLGSLFDGSGTCPLAAKMLGITPVWASEIEPFPIAVTSARFPEMKHMGNIADINGAKLEPVDIITFGSPCQDLSIAGKRKGLENGSRSSLFYEATRIIHEMREATNGKYPRFAMWENVTGAFSSNKGEDFRSVLEVFCAEAGHTDSIPRPANGKWTKAGEIVGDDFSIGWRTLDAQYWGVPQRRRRIFLVADFRGECARNVLFEREVLQRNLAESGNKGKEIATDATGCTRGGGGGGGCLNSYAPQAHRVYSVLGVYPTLHTPTGGNSNGSIVYALQGYGIDRAVTAGCGGRGWNDSSAYTLNTVDKHAVAYEKRPRVVVRGGGRKYCVRRLTPLEYGRLQGFPDDWLDNLGIKNPSPEDVTKWKGIFETHRKLVNPKGKSKSEKQIAKWLRSPYSI